MAGLSKKNRLLIHRATKLYSQEKMGLDNWLNVTLSLAGTNKTRDSVGTKHSNYNFAFN